MFKKIFWATVSGLCCLFASFCVGIYVRSTVFDGVYLRPLDGAILLMFACVLVYVAARSSGIKLFPQQREPLMRCALSFAYVLYVVLLCDFLFFETAFDRQHSLILLQDGETVSNYLEDYLNLEPFSMIRRYFRGFAMGTVGFQEFFMNIFGNFILFTPFAFFLPIYYEKQRHFPVFFITVTVLSLIAEGLQVLFMSGTGDVDDLILNVSGSCLLFALLGTKIGKKLVVFIKN